mmetsp:Transcript_26947/g.82716  ORF Transcript_26947/g.82716 Transcript_26947/m.82716 type:complete len:314 (+) Transcript_26947:2240-3181(+)
MRWESSRKPSSTATSRRRQRRRRSTSTARSLESSGRRSPFSRRRRRRRRGGRKRGEGLPTTTRMEEERAKKRTGLQQSGCEQQGVVDEDEGERRRATPVGRGASAHNQREDAAGGGLDFTEEDPAPQPSLKSASRRRGRRGRPTVDGGRRAAEAEFDGEGVVELGGLFVLAGLVEFVFSEVEAVVRQEAAVEPEAEALGLGGDAAGVEDDEDLVREREVRQREHDLGLELEARFGGQHAGAVPLEVAARHLEHGLVLVAEARERRAMHAELPQKDERRRRESAAARQLQAVLPVPAVVEPLGDALRRGGAARP